MLLAHSSAQQQHWNWKLPSTDSGATNVTMRCPALCWRPLVAIAAILLLLLREIDEDAAAAVLEAAVLRGYRVDDDAAVSFGRDEDIGRDRLLALLVLRVIFVGRLLLAADVVSAALRYNCCLVVATGAGVSGSPFCA
jgi:hypothetical protein